MKNKKLFLIVYISFVIITIIALIILSILGSKSRIGYLSNFKLNIERTLDLNNLSNIVNNELDEESLNNYLLTNENITNYVYNFRIRYYDKIFRNSYIYGVYPNLFNLPDYMKNAEMEFDGSPYGNFISDKRLDGIEEENIDNINYILKIKFSIIISCIVLIISILLFLLIINYNIEKLINIIFPILISLSIFIATYLCILSSKNMAGHIYTITILLLTLLLINKFADKIYSLLFNSKNEKFILIFTAIFIGALYIFIINSSYPFVGHDFSLIIPRAYSMLLYAQNNGIFNIEFASPLFGAGTLSYPNPQYDQFSIFYFLRYLMPFWNAYLLSIFIFVIIGFISFYYIEKDILKCSFEISLTAAILFSCTGYYIHHIMVGHWAFLYHPFTAVIILASFSDRLNPFIRIIISALSFSIMIFGGAMQTIFFLTCFSLLGVACILFKPNKKFILQSVSIIISAMLGIIMAISKFIPSLILGSKIDRGPWGLYTNDPKLLIENISNIIWYPILDLVIGNINLINSFGFEWLIWEADISLPLIIFIIIIFFAFKYSKKDFINFVDRNKFNIILTIILIYLYCDIFFADGLIRSSFKKLRGVNIHLRMASVWISPIIFIFILLLKNIKNKYAFIYKKIILISIFITIILFSFKFILIRNYNTSYKNLNISFDKNVYKEIKNNHNKFKVNSINDKNEFNNMQDYLNGTYKLNSSRFPYEPIYGYFLETFKAKELGCPFKIVDNKFNFTDPRSLIFFNENYPQFSGFDTNDFENLNKFLSFQKVDWRMDKYFNIANYISVILHIIVLSILIIYAIYCFIKKVKLKNIR